jgi:3-oxoadipate enol-lactonase
MGKSSASETTVLIHGLSEEGRVWSRQQQFLQSYMEVVSYDIRGFGNNPVGDGLGTVDQMSGDLAQVLDRHECGPAWLVGFSMGGVIAQRFALDSPDMVRGLVLIASSCTVGKPGVEFFKQRIRKVSTGGHDAIRTITMADASGCFSNSDEQLIEEYRQLRTAAVRDVDGYVNACRAMLRLADEPMMHLLGKIDCPTLVIAGELDPYCPPRASEMIAGAIPGAELIVVPGAGHMLHWELPEHINGLILEFIEQTGQG